MAAAAPALTLTVNNTAEFWETLWRTNATHWKIPELQSPPFANNIFNFARAAGLIADDAAGDDKTEAVKNILRGQTALVPLCGDSLVLSFLTDVCGASLVIGVELSEDAINRAIAAQFSEEKGWVFGAPETIATAGAAPIVVRVGRREATSQQVRFYQADLFAPELAAALRTTAAVSMFYCRGSFVALPVELRPKYVAFIRAFARDNGRFLGGYFEQVRRDPAKPETFRAGPPFHCEPSEVEALYADAAIVDSADGATALPQMRIVALPVVADATPKPFPFNFVDTLVLPM